MGDYDEAQSCWLCGNWVLTKESKPAMMDYYGTNKLCEVCDKTHEYIYYGEELWMNVRACYVGLKGTKREVPFYEEFDTDEKIAQYKKEQLAIRDALL
tara:strand:+ start:294 stop:587 length:294 start_codon:yes stop_codon:yes gene_type:complete